jgi:serine/threonine-protein kinase
MDTEARINELLDRWEELRDLGNAPSIQSVCRDCPELAGELRRRIRAFREMDSVLDIWATDVGSTPESAVLPGAREPGLPGAVRATAIYRPQRRHAAGGQGEVLAARQDALDRMVALKRLRPDRVSETAWRRFEREAAITARLQHPGIVPIYGAGEDDDGPFYAMPLIEGRTLERAIDEFHRKESLRRDPGQRSLRFRGLLQHFITVCNTVAYAHDQGVIHRDLKPSNIMLGPYGETLVMDWGLAKRAGIDDARAEGEEGAPSTGPSPEALTATGAVLGTPYYMSPEQARGEPATPASDIFSLGLIMYAILTGKSAYADAVERGDEFGDSVRRALIVPPRQCAAGVPRPLEAVCLKALALLPEHRYTAANALAGDIAKWLADEPVSTYREPWRERTRRWSRKHRTLATSALIMLVLGLMGSAGVAAVATSMNRELARQTQRTEARERLAIDAISRFRDVVVEEPALKNNSALEALRKKLLKEPLAFFQLLRDQHKSSPRTGAKVINGFARAIVELAYTTAELGSVSDAIGSYTEAIALIDGLVNANPSVTEFQSDLAQTHGNIAVLQSATGQTNQALESFCKASAIWERLVRENPSVTTFRSKLGRTYGNIGVLQTDTGQLNRALESCGKALAIQKRLARENRSATEFQSDLATTLYNIGRPQLATGQPDQALE